MYHAGEKMADIYAYQKVANIKSELEKEEMLLKSVRGKLLDQLQRLKVEELALMKYLSLTNPSNVLEAASTSTASYFSAQTNQTGSDTTQNEDQVNSLPLSDLTNNLASNPLIVNNSCNVEEEEEEDDD